MNVKLGIVQSALPGFGNFTARIAAEAGLDGVQLEMGFGSYEHGMPLSQRRVQDLYLEEGAKHNITYPSVVAFELIKYGICSELGSEDHTIARDILTRSISIAERMNMDMVMIPSFGGSALDTDEQFGNMVEEMKRFCDMAGEKGIEIAHEAVIPWERELELMERVGRKNFKLVYDTLNYSIFRRIDQYETLTKLYDTFSSHFHIKDGKGSNGGGLLGTGDGLFHETVDFLKQKDFSGWIHLENSYDTLPLRGTDPAEDPFALLKKDVETLRAAMK